ncbi:MAG: polynucleotide adenylyltransferase PcnB, partial [Erythrobacter sp.]|nr:polynucleotide adenylyltransferase PcnB [Erythrobacter sp.]
MTAQSRPGKPGRKPRKGRGRTAHQPVIIAAADHAVTRKTIARSAQKVLDKLHEAGHSAYLVGGGVRDALVGLRPKDFDVATDASPETIRALFRNSRIIGRRFRLVHVVYGREIIEVATFRAAHSKGEGGEVGSAGRIVRDNVFGSIEEDACRRDFSVNALYYNLVDGTVVDYVGGLADLDAGVFRLIGDPVTRCEEDPVRVLRAVRLAAKLDFDIAEDTLAAMRQVRGELKSTPPPRLFEEVLKLFQGGYALRSFHSIREHELLHYLFPLLDERLKAGDEALETMLDAALQ